MLLLLFLYLSSESGIVEFSFNLVAETSVRFAQDFENDLWMFVKDRVFQNASSQVEARELLFILSFFSS